VSYKDDDDDNDDEFCGRKNETFDFTKEDIFRPPRKLPSVQENLVVWLVG
jgi:hypothetical protein